MSIPVSQLIPPPLPLWSAELFHVLQCQKMLHAHKPGLGKPVCGNISEDSQAYLRSENAGKHEWGLLAGLGRAGLLSTGLGKLSVLRWIIFFLVK